MFYSMFLRKNGKKIKKFADFFVILQAVFVK